MPLLANTLNNNHYRIGEIAEKLGIPIDTLRYYEKINIIPPPRRNNGVRLYNELDMSRLRFLRRAQRMGFSLEEIKLLLELRQRPRSARAEIRVLAHKKLEEISQHVKEMKILEKELKLLTNLCTNADGNCPIIEGIEDIGAGPKKLTKRRKVLRP